MIFEGCDPACLEQGALSQIADQACNLANAKVLNTLTTPFDGKWPAPVTMVKILAESEFDLKIQNSKKTFNIFLLVKKIFRILFQLKDVASHFSAHTFTQEGENNKIGMLFWTCGNVANPALAFDFLKKSLKAQKACVMGPIEISSNNSMFKEF